MFVAGCSPARDKTSKGYIAYGHSMVVDPMGKILAQASDKETIIYADLDMNALNETRTSIPIYAQRRFDVYQDVSA